MQFSDILNLKNLILRPREAYSNKNQKSHVPTPDGNNGNPEAKAKDGHKCVEPMVFHLKIRL